VPLLNKHSLDEWLKTQPAHVKGAAELFPIGQPFLVHARTYWVIGYTCMAELVCIEVDPGTLDDSTFKRLVHAATLFEPAAIVGVATRH
jgi:hypothetical protein